MEFEPWCVTHFNIEQHQDFGVLRQVSLTLVPQRIVTAQKQRTVREFVSSVAGDVVRSSRDDGAGGQSFISVRVSVEPSGTVERCVREALTVARHAIDEALMGLGEGLGDEGKVE